MFRMIARIGLFAAVALPLAAGAASADKLDVVASFSIIGDFATHVGGDRISLTTLAGPDGDAHVYEPKPADAAALASADVVLINGLGFEGFMDRLVQASGSRAPIVDLAKGVATVAASDGHDHEGHGHEAKEGDDPADRPIDPHAFQSVPNAIVYVNNIADAFCAADASDCDAFRANAAAYVATLTALDAELRSTVGTIPEDRRVVISSHAAFSYLGKEYGLRFLAPEGASTAAEASAADIARLIDQIREEKASALFVENVSNARLIEQIAAETGLEVGGALYSDALSAPDGPAPTYVDMMRHNVGAIAAAIRGN